jgi:hypothetical protein
MYNNQKDICDYLLNLDVMNNGSITKDGNITNTVVNKRRINTLLKAESGASGPEPVTTTRIPKIPKTIDE